MSGALPVLLAVAMLAAETPPEMHPLPAPQPELPEEGANPWVVAGTSAAIVGVLAAWGWGAWWSDGFESFHFKETGFLNRDTYAGGSDKVGHMYTCFLATRATTRLYETLGMSPRSAAIMSASAVTLVANGIEVADGFTQYGFEYGDSIFNTLGIGVALASDLSPDFESMFGMRVGYVPSHDFLAHDKTFIKFINDYTGMLFYFDIKLKGVLEHFDRDPGLARYLFVGPVWGTDHYSPVRVHEERRRSLGLHLSVSLSQILRDAYPDDEGVESFATFFDYYAVPFLSVTVMSDLNTGAWFLNFGVSNRFEIGL